MTVSFFLGCSKGRKNQNGPQTAGGIKIEIVSGNNFTDTIDRYDAVTLKVTQNEAPIGGYKVYYHGSGCNADHVDSSVTATDGITGYNWSLSGELGLQTLGVYGSNAQHQKVDSITVTGTGIAPGIGWHAASCAIFTGFNPWSYCKLSTGRIFANFMNGSTFLRYSDDNGRSWFPVKGLGNQHEIEFVISTPADEVLAITYTDGVLYSNDAGQSWTVMNAQEFYTETVLSAVYTAEGKLLVTTTQHPLCISSDKGKTWTNTSISQFVPINSVQSANGQDGLFMSAAEDATGNLYVTADESQTIYKSTDNGASWVPLPNGPFGAAYSFYIDKNNWFYKSEIGDMYGGIYISKDGGTTWTPLASDSNVAIHDISLQSDGNLYSIINQQGLCVEKNATGPIKPLYSDNGAPTFMGHVPYIVAANNNIVITNEEYSRIFYYQY